MREEVELLVKIAEHFPAKINSNFIQILYSWFPMSTCADKTVHNLNEFIEILTEDISTNVGAELINDITNKKLGVVMNENQLEEFFSQVSQ